MIKDQHELLFNILLYGEDNTNVTSFLGSKNYALTYENIVYFLEIIETNDHKVILVAGDDTVSHPYSTAHTIQPEHVKATIQLYPLPKKKEGFGRIFMILRMKHKKLFAQYNYMMAWLENEGDISKKKQQKTLARKAKKGKVKQKVRQRRVT